MMILTAKNLLRLIAIIFLPLTHTFAADNPVYYNEKGAIGGADTVAYFSLAAGEKPIMGSDEFAHIWQGAKWKFSSAENRDKFIANPAKYAPQYGGYCAYAVALGKTASIKPKYWAIVNEKLYLNYNWLVYHKWKHSKDDYIVKADQNWPNALKTCEKKNKCRPQQK